MILRRFPLLGGTRSSSTVRLRWAPPREVCIRKRPMSRSSKSSEVKSVPKNRVERSCNAMRRSRPAPSDYIHLIRARSGKSSTISKATPFTSGGSVKRSTALLDPCDPSVRTSSCFIGHLALRVDHSQRAFITLRLQIVCDSAIPAMISRTSCALGKAGMSTAEAKARAYSYSSASTSDPRTAASAGPSLRQRAPRIEA